MDPQGSNPEEMPMFEIVKNERRDIEKPTCFQRYVLYSLVAITIFSCTMTVITAITYFTMDNHNHRHEEQNQIPEYGAVRQSDNYTMKEEYPVYAHKILGMSGSRIVKGESNTLVIANPKNNNSPFETGEGVTLLRHGIQILHPGTYFVYKSIYFKPSSRLECSKLEIQNFTSYLMLNSTLNARGITTLVETHHSCCPSCADSSQTAFAGGVFYLRRGDIVQVEAKEDFVDVAKNVAYIGLMKLGTLQ